jgi:hypothetical protein
MNTQNNAQTTPAAQSGTSKENAAQGQQAQKAEQGQSKIEPKPAETAPVSKS